MSPQLILTHWGRVTHICVGNHWVRLWLVTWSAPSHYLNQCWDIVNWTLRNKLQWTLNRNSNLFIQENHLKVSSAKWRPFCVGLNELKAYWTICHHWVRSRKGDNPLPDPVLTTMYGTILVSLGLIELSHLPLDKMAAISLTTFSNAFSWMKSLAFWFKFHWSLS